MITERQIGLAAPTALKTGRLHEAYPFIVSAMQHCQITTPVREDYFLANYLEETGELQARVENLNYSGERLMAVWPSLFSSLDQANALAAQGPEAIANYVYADANRPPDYRMGNTQSGDGWKFRGRGGMQLTGRSAYEHYFRRVGLPIDSDPDLLLTPEHAALSAAIYWQDAGCNEIADRGDFTAEVVKINGGTINLGTRQMYESRLEEARLHPDPVVQMAQVVPPVQAKPADIPAPPPSADVPVTNAELKLPPQLAPVEPLPPVPPPPVVAPPGWETRPNGNVVRIDPQQSPIVKKARWGQVVAWLAGGATLLSQTVAQFKQAFASLFGSVVITDTIAICLTVVACTLIIAAGVALHGTGKERVKMWLQGIA